MQRRMLRREYFKLERLNDRTIPAVGGLDATFNAIGTQVIGFDLGGQLQDTGTDLVVQPDGKIVVVGSVDRGNGDFDFGVIRLNTDGTLDTTFGNSGRAVIAFDLGGTKNDTPLAVALQNDGRIVVVGSAVVNAFGDTDFAVARLTATGQLDTTFGGGSGRTTIGFDLGGTNLDSAADVAIQADGRIVIVGSAQVGLIDFDFAAVRLLSNGNLDTTFGNLGRQTIAFDLGGTLADQATGVALQADQRIIIAGSVARGVTFPVPSADKDFGVVRLTTLGQIDTTFGNFGGGLGVYAFDLGGKDIDTPAAVAIQPSDGKIVVAGTVTTNSNGSDFAVLRLLANGIEDTSFGTNARTTFGFNLGGGKNDSANALVLSADGRIIVAGSAELAGGDFDFAIARLTFSGQLDTSFAGTGLAVVGFDQGGTNIDSANGVALTPDGRIVVAGAVSGAGADVDFGTARLFGSLGLPSAIVAGGNVNGQANGFLPDANGLYSSSGSFTPFSAFVSGALVRSAVGDVNGDGFQDTIYVVGPGGGSLLRVVSGLDNSDLLSVTQTYESTFTGGLFVAAGDIDGDGRAEIVVSPDVGGGGRVQIFRVLANQLVQLDNFFGIDDLAFRGGARVALGDVNGDSRLDLIVGAGFLGGPRVAIFSGAGLLANAANPPKLIPDFFAFPGPDTITLRNGVFVTAGDIDGDGKAELVFGGGPGGAPRVFVLSGAQISLGNIALAQNAPLANFFVNNDTLTRGGVRLAMKDIDDDNRADLVVGSGEFLPTSIRTYLGSSFPSPNSIEPPALQTFDPFTLGALANGVFVG